MTLVELMMAVAIAGVLLAVVFAVYCSILNTVALQNSWRDKTMPGANALDFMARDLACAVVPFGITNPPFAAAYLEKSEKAFKMSFYSAFPTRSARSETSWQGEASERAATTNDWRAYSVSLVSYTLCDGGTAGEQVLIRASIPFRVPSRNQLSSVQDNWGGIRKLNIVFFDGSGWVNQWGDGKNTNALPQAVRINMVTGLDGRKQTGTEVFINAARQIVPKKTVSKSAP